MGAKPAGGLPMKLLSVVISAIIIFMCVSYVLALAQIRQHGRYAFWEYTIAPVVLVGLLMARRWIRKQLRLREG